MTVDRTEGINIPTMPHTQRINWKRYVGGERDGEIAVNTPTMKRGEYLRLPEVVDFADRYGPDLSPLGPTFNTHDYRCNVVKFAAAERVIEVYAWVGVGINDADAAYRILVRALSGEGAP